MSQIYLGIKGHVVCVEKQTGKKMWSTKLKGGMKITNVYCDSKNIYAYTSGHLFCLDQTFGKVQWVNTLSGYGYGACIFATNDNIQQQTAVISHDLEQKNAQAAHAAT